ncbi:MFS transporter [Nocardiopsis sp. MG754419]|uniref:MFS transporter n=1 Tax=Nocardiopsis sp. MG754419 TaxID=2259865 RepID=UPI001BA937CF|nr:MFS transporter [Nocardiopsis sp. MG754419]MBR8744355.1 MFS transporter [Nocardiopsis sp. MG754419]
MSPDTAQSHPGTVAAEKQALYARSALAGYFFLTGALLPVWASRIPAVKDQAGVGADQLGLALLCMGVGAMVTARLGGALLDRCAPRFVIAPAAVAAALCLILPGTARGPQELAAALFVLGTAHSLLNVSVNTHAAVLQRPLGRSLMSSFHAFVSLGACFGALCGMFTAYAGLSPLVAFQSMGVLLALVALLPVGALVRFVPPEPRHPRPDGGAEPRPRLSPHLLLVGALVLAAMLSESAVQDWSALFAQESVGASGTFAASVFAAFTVTMTLGRLMGDRLALWLGRVNLLRSGALLVIGGFAIALGIPWPATVLLGFALVGLGLSCAVPQLFSAAAEIDPRHVGRNLGTVAAIGYLGPLVGAPVIGMLSAQFGVGTGLLLPVLLACGLALGAGVARPRGQSPLG